MSFQQPDITNLDNNKVLRFPRFKYLIEVIDLESQKILHQRTDHGGYHTCGTFTENENIVIYLTFDHHWFSPPIIKIWNLKKGTVEEIITSHDTQAPHLTLAYHNAMQRLVLGAFDGYVSAYNIQKKEVMWHYKQPENSNIDHFLSMDFSKCGEKVATLQKDNMTIYDFTTGKKLLSTPLMDEYSTCRFQAEDLLIHLTHDTKQPIKISCKALTR
jgi:WD40 repeat protein